MGTFERVSAATASLRSAGPLDVLICTPASPGLRAPRFRNAKAGKIRARLSECQVNCARAENILSRIVVADPRRARARDRAGAPPPDRRDARSRLAAAQSRQLSAGNHPVARRQAARPA